MLTNPVVVLIHGLQWLPWLFIFPGIAGLLSVRTRRAGGAAIAGGYLLAALVGQVVLPVLAPAALLLLARHLATRADRRTQALGHLLFLVTAIALRLHIAPGFHNPPILDGNVSMGASSVKAYFNLDKLAAALWILAVIPPINWETLQVPRAVGRGVFYGLATFVPLAIAGLAITAVAIDPKVPSVFPLWALNNILLVAFCEEVFFRAYLQAAIERSMRTNPWAPWIAVIGASLLFGLAHFGVGWRMQLLTTLAGVGYGLAYRRAGLLGAIIAHATLNIAHFLLLTYPALQH